MDASKNLVALKATVEKGAQLKNVPDDKKNIRERDMEIHNLEMETSESHGTFKIP